MTIPPARTANLAFQPATNPTPNLLKAILVPSRLASSCSSHLSFLGRQSASSSSLQPIRVPIQHSSSKFTPATSGSQPCCYCSASQQANSNLTPASLGSQPASNPTPKLVQPILVPSRLVANSLQPSTVAGQPASLLQFVPASLCFQPARNPAPSLLRPVLVASRLVSNLLQLPPSQQTSSKSPKVANLLQRLLLAGPPAS